MHQPRSRWALFALALLILAAWALPACAQRSEPAAHDAPDAAALAPAASRALRISADVTVEVSDVDGAAQRLRDAAREAGGYVAHAQVGGAKERAAELELKVPIEALEQLRAAIAGVGTIRQQSEKAEDVTEQRADLKARIRNARVEEQRVLELLESRTGALADVVAVEKLLAEVRDKIERLEAQESTLDGQVTYATVRVHVTPTPEVASAAARIVAAGGRGWQLLTQVLVGTAVVLATIGPTVLVAGAIAYVLYRLRKLLPAAKAQPGRSASLR